MISPSGLAGRPAQNPRKEREEEQAEEEEEKDI